MALRLLLAILGISLSIGSRLLAGMRAAITRDLVIEIATLDGVARHYVCRNRTMNSVSGSHPSPDCALRFATSKQALLTLTSRRATNRLYAGLVDGSITISGNPFHALWFYDLTQWVIPLAARPSWATPPGRYVKPNTTAAWAKRVTREPVATELDPRWTDAALQRAKLKMMRVVAGEPALEF